MKLSDVKKSAKREMNEEFKNLSQALKMFKALAKGSKMQELSTLLNGDCTSALDLKPSQILSVQRYQVYEGEVFACVARKTKNGFVEKQTWTINDIFESFVKFHTQRFKQDKIQINELIKE